MLSRVRLPGSKTVVLPAAVLAALLLAGCSGEGSSAPELGPTQPAVSPTLEAPAATAWTAAVPDPTAVHSAAGGRRHTVAR